MYYSDFKKNIFLFFASYLPWETKLKSVILTWERCPLDLQKEEKIQPPSIPRESSDGYSQPYFVFTEHRMMRIWMHTDMLALKIC